MLYTDNSSTLMWISLFLYCYFILQNDDSHHSVSHCLKELDFSQALEGLRLCHGLSNAEGENSTPKNADLGDLELGRKALYLTELHGKFGHKYASIHVYSSPIICNMKKMNNVIVLFRQIPSSQCIPCSFSTCNQINRWLHFIPSWLFNRVLLFLSLFNVQPTF